jgi:hypothetical protein
MKLTPEEKRTVELVEKGVGRVFWSAFCGLLFVAVIRVALVDKNPAEKPVKDLKTSELQEIIRDEVQRALHPVLPPRPII